MPGAQLEDEAQACPAHRRSLPGRPAGVTLCGSRTPARRSIPAPTSTCMSIPRRVITRLTSRAIIERLGGASRLS